MRLLAAILALACLTSCSTLSLRCEGQVNLTLEDRKIVMRCPSGPMPVVTIDAEAVTGP